MGYFSNGTEGMEYEAKWCSRCIYESKGCAVWLAHLLYNGEEGKKDVLDILIPRSKDGLSNNKCTMFRTSIKPNPTDDGEPMLFQKHEIGGSPVEIKETA